jgi:sigma-B regulation protein RsbU (phosphoserine phosphatase)
VGGDFYDIFRLDEHHVGFYVADVVGHGVPASLLTIFLKKAVRPKEITAGGYRLLPPDEVLQNLNREMIGQGLAENPFITMVYAVLNCENQTLSFARAGHPYPVYLPHSGEPEIWRLHGPILGVFDAPFSAQTTQLKPGDKLLIHTDGLHSGDDENQAGSGPLIAAAAHHRSLPVGELVERVAQDVGKRSGQMDDFTLLGLEVEDPGSGGR